MAIISGDPLRLANGLILRLSRRLSSDDEGEDNLLDTQQHEQGLKKQQSINQSVNNAVQVLGSIDLIQPPFSSSSR